MSGAPIKQRYSFWRLNREMSSLTEPRAVLSTLTSKFQALDDSKSIENINLHYERIISDRVDNLSTSREILHRTISW